MAKYIIRLDGSRSPKFFTIGFFSTFAFVIGLMQTAPLFFEMEILFKKFGIWFFLGLIVIAAVVTFLYERFQNRYAFKKETTIFLLNLQQTGDVFKVVVPKHQLVRITLSNLIRYLNEKLNYTVFKLIEEGMLIPKLINKTQNDTEIDLEKTFSKNKVEKNDLCYIEGVPTKKGSIRFDTNLVEDKVQRNKLYKFKKLWISFLEKVVYRGFDEVRIYDNYLVFIEKE